MPPSQARGGGAVVGGAGFASDRVALGDGREVHRHAAVGALGLVRQAAIDERIVDLLRDGLGVRDTRLQTPRPAVHAAVARILEVVQRDELARQAVQAGRDLARKLRDRAVTVGAVVQITQHLIEGAIFLDDVDHVLDLASQEAHRVLAFGIGRVEVVLRDLRGQSRSSRSAPGTGAATSEARSSWN